jgi:cellulose synthase/poly-beta-1,6-N-acetylglucosamine synthase-like glycosyltransferase
MISWIVTSYFLTAFYCCLIAFFYVGLLAIILRTKRQNKLPISPVQNSFSIVISARNEAGFISQCLVSIINQNYDANQFEIIVINDHSTI